MKLGQNICLDETSDNFKIGSCGSKTRSLGEIFHIFSPILMKLGQNVCLDKIMGEFENGSCQVKIRTNLKKTCVCCRGLIFGLIHMNLGQNICSDDILNKFES